MKRLRITLLVVSLAVVVPVVVLAWRAIEGLAFERSVRHQVVAERAFDEMERALSRFLEREESRPFEHYRFYPDGREERSPLARPLAEPFVVGAFQIDPDGSLHTPLRPRDVAAAARRGDWPPPEPVVRSIAEVERVVGAVWRAGPEELADVAPEPAADDALARQAPGTTRRLDAGAPEPEVAPLARLEEAAAGRATAYEVLQSFNRGADSRAERKQKVMESEWREGARRPAPRRSRAGSLGAALADRDEEAAKRADQKDEATPPGFAEPVRVALDPMVGRSVGGDRLLLYRTVLVGRQGYRQGLLLDRDALGSWLEERVVAPSGLARVGAISFPGPGESAGELREGSVSAYQHRFAEPFDALSARLELATLPGVGSPRAVYALVALLAIVGTAGLFAIHRMAGVVVEFAERRNDFVSAVTHELKTPLTAIRMYAEMLRDGLVDSDDKRDRYHRTITDESERLSRLIDNVLEFSRLERGRREMNLRAGPLAPVVEEVVEGLRAHAERQGFELRADIEADLPGARFDRDALVQVLFNLVDNAMKYAAGSGRNEVVIEARRDGDAVALGVRDFGPGVSGRHLARIFEPFYRGEHELTRTTRGTGIGLALVKELVERMGGAVRGDNAEGGGFRVRIALQTS